MGVKRKKLIIIGAGPAGLTAAYELSLLNRFDITVVEADSQVGGISKTVDYKGNLIDIGGHRFFSKSEKVLNWWMKFLPLIDTTNHQEITYHNQHISLDGLIARNAERAMLLRPRKSRIFYNKRFFDYPLNVSLQLILNLGKKKSLRIIRDMLLAKARPIKPETNLEEFYINRFGKELYETFFKDYTKKVWGKSCSEISNEWGRQRIKTVGLISILVHKLKSVGGCGCRVGCGGRVDTGGDAQLLGFEE